MPGRVHTMLVVLLMVGSGSIMATGPTDPAARPTVRLLNLHLFWVDDDMQGVASKKEASPTSLDEQWDFRHYDYARSHLLRAEDSAGWHDGSGSALVVVPRLGDRWAHYTLTTALRDPHGGQRYRVDSVIGTRTRVKFGTLHTLDLARVATLPRFAREEVGDLVNPHLLERSIYWEGAFELTGLRRDEIKRVDALGPGLIKPPRKWLRVLDEMMQAPEILAQAEGHNCLGIGPLRLCLNIPDLVKTLGSRGSLKERNQVRLTRSLWHAGESSGVVVVGRLIDYSMVTFRVRTNGKGSHRKGEFDLPPFRLTGALATPPRRDHPAGVAPGRSNRPARTVKWFDSARRIPVGRDTTLRLNPVRRPPSAFLSLESILERAFSPERE